MTWSVLWQIVGVFHTMNNSQELGDDSRPEVILPFWQSPRPDAAVAVSTAGNPEAVRKDVAVAVRAIDPDLPLVNVRTMMDIVRERLAPDRRNRCTLRWARGGALLLAALGRSARCSSRQRSSRPTCPRAARAPWIR